ncbi:fimbrillin family protein [Bacteroides sp.]|uniref:fimbrillin family protein n=1 Tax=Bacteroides sp. TaxID=29523 RepID=UPI002636A285|nr:fimbrillin family protein [Bacteroides sp.]
MKKILLMALAAAAMVGCSQNEEIDNAAQKAKITFGTVVSNSTRATVTSIAGLQGTGFTVYAYNTGADEAGVANLPVSPFMGDVNGLAVTYNEAKWGFTGTYYWPSTGNIQFYAYATDDDATNYTATGKYPTINYAVAATVGAQKDFVVAKAENEKKSDNAVDLTFKHALTQINFSATGGDANLYYKVTAVSIGGAYGAGTYNFKDGSWETITTDAVKTYAYLTNGAVSVKKTATVDLVSADGPLMLIPQTLADGKIMISYSVYTDEAMTNEIASVTDNLTEGLTTVWGTGKKVRYTLTLNLKGATVSFAPGISGWDEPEIEG